MIIGENIILAYELIRDFKKPGKPRTCIKIDLQKAYNMVDRKFTCHMLSTIGFPNSLIALIYECISSPTFSMPTEGIPYGFMHSNRGLRQEDPLLPYLFCIAMKFLSLKLKDGVSQSKLKPMSNVTTYILTPSLCS